MAKAKKTTKRRFVLEIEVDEDAVQQKYPNFRYNYSNGEELIEAVKNSITFIAGTDMTKDGMENWGYSIKVI